MDAKESGIKRAQLARFEFAAALGHVIVHDLGPLALVIRDHVHSRDEVDIGLTGRAGLGEPAAGIPTQQKFGGSSEAAFISRGLAMDLLLLSQVPVEL